MHFLLWIAVLDSAIWLYLLLAHGQFWQTNTLCDTPAPAIWPRVSVIIPARNEANIIETTLPSLLGNDYPHLAILLVDDKSEDETASTAERIAESLNAASRFTVIRSLSMPGWKGKVAAMQSGLEHIAASNAPDYVLFTDADIRYEKGALKQLVSHAEQNQTVLTSLMVKLRCEDFAERLLIPAFVYFFQLLYPFSRINNPRWKIAAAAGGCMLVNYAALQQAQGFTPIKNALIDDCALARVMKKQGSIWLGLTQHIHSVRPYSQLSDIRAMVSRSAYDQLNYSSLLLLSTLIGMTLIYVMPVMLMLFADGNAQLLGVFSWLLMSATFIPMLRFYHRPFLGALLLPVIALFYMVYTFDSAFQYMQGKGGMWKGRAQAKMVGSL